MNFSIFPTYLQKKIFFDQINVNLFAVLILPYFDLISFIKAQVHKSCITLKCPLIIIFLQMFRKFIFLNKTK